MFCVVLLRIQKKLTEIISFSTYKWGHAALKRLNMFLWSASK